MAGVFELIRGPQRWLVGHHGVVQLADPRALELQAATEILAEVFKVRLSDVDAIIRSRFEIPPSEAIGLKNVLLP